MTGTGLRQSVPTRGMRIATPCANQVEFIEAFHRYCEDNSFFVSTLTMRQIGLVSAFSVDLTDGRAMLRGYGVVLDAWPTAENRFGRPGVHIGIHKLTADSQAVFDQLLIARAVTSDRKAQKDAARTMTRQLWAITPAPLPTIPSVTPRATPSPTPPRTTTQIRGAGSALAIVVPVVPRTVTPRTVTPPAGARTVTPPVVSRTVTPPVSRTVTPLPRVVTPPPPVEASDPVFDQEGPTDTMEPRDVLAAMPPTGGDAVTVESAVPIAAAATASEPVTFETPTRTASPTYAATLASERARERSPAVARPAASMIDDADDAPTKPPEEPAPLPPLAYEPPHRPSPVVAVSAALGVDTPSPLAAARARFEAMHGAQTAGPVVSASSAAIAAPVVSAQRAPTAKRQRSWWLNPRVVVVFAIGIAAGFGVNMIVQSTASSTPVPVAAVPTPPPSTKPPPPPVATPPIATPPPTTTAVQTPPTTTPTETPPTTTPPTTATPPVTVAPAHPVAKPAPVRPVAKPVRPIPKPVARPVRPKPQPTVVKPKCEGLSCI